MQRLARSGWTIGASIGLLIACGEPNESALFGARGGEAAQTKAQTTPTHEAAPNTASAVREPARPAAPEGAITVGDPPLFVQTCEAAHPCPDLLQREGMQHCAKLTLGTAPQWRLPTREELERLESTGTGLEQLQGYHWTSTEYEEDANQVWIVDPTSDQPTTVPRDRKRFRIRCVREP